MHAWDSSIEKREYLYNVLYKHAVMCYNYIGRFLCACMQCKPYQSESYTIIMASKPDIDRPRDRPIEMNMLTQG